MDNLLRDLQQAWERDGDSGEARAALARWADSHPGVSAYATPGQLVRACRSRTDATAEQLVEALTEQAPYDPWATRTVLQAPPARLGRHRPAPPRPRRRRAEPFTTTAELDHFVVCTAFERITQVAAQAQDHRLRCVLDSTWTRLRSHARAHRRDYDSRVALVEAADRDAAPARSDAEELANALIEAVERGLLRPADAGLVYATRVVGHPPADVAATLACRVPTLVRRRHRVEQVLAAEVLGRPRPRGCYVASVSG